MEKSDFEFFRWALGSLNGRQERSLTSVGDFENPPLIITAAQALASPSGGRRSTRPVKRSVS